MRSKTGIKPKLKKVTVYLTTEEYDELKEKAQALTVTLSALIRAELRLPEIFRGAPKRKRKKAVKPVTKFKRA